MLSSRQVGSLQSAGGLTRTKGEAREKKQSLLVSRSCPELHLEPVLPALLVLRPSGSDWNYITRPTGSPGGKQQIMGLLRLHNHTCQFLIIISFSINLLWFFFLWRTLTHTLPLQKLNLFLTRIRWGRTFLSLNDVMTKRRKEAHYAFLNSPLCRLFSTFFALQMPSPSETGKLFQWRETKTLL